MSMQCPQMSRAQHGAKKALPEIKKYYPQQAHQGMIKPIDRKLLVCVLDSMAVYFNDSERCYSMINKNYFNNVFLFVCYPSNSIALVVVTTCNFPLL